MKTAVRISAILLALALSAEAFAGHPPKQPPVPPVKPSPVVTIDTSAHAGAAAFSGSDADASATGGSATAAGGAGGTATSTAEGGQGVGDVDVGGDSTRVRSLGVALSVPAATAAPAVPGLCLEHSRGWQAGWGAAARSGGTKLQQRCEERVHCLAIADRYASAGLLQAMADQLATCGGVSVKVVPPPPAPPAASNEAPKTDTVTRQEFAAEVQRLEQRQDAAFARGLSK
jgi:hypothetical protein